MINPPVSLYASMSRLDRLFGASIGPADEGIERLYRQIYAQLANLYRTSDGLPIDESSLLGAAALELNSDTELSAAIALSFRLTLTNMFFLGDLYARTGILVNPAHPPQPDDSLESTLQRLRAMPFSEYFSRVFTPYYLQRRDNATSETLIADNRLDIIGPQLRDDSDYYVQTNSDDLILDQPELQWLRETLGGRIVVYDHGGHLGSVGERQQIADMLDMLSGRWGDDK